MIVIVRRANWPNLPTSVDPIFYRLLCPEIHPDRTVCLKVSKIGCKYIWYNQADCRLKGWCGPLCGSSLAEGKVHAQCHRNKHFTVYNLMKTGSRSKEHIGDTSWVPIAKIEAELISTFNSITVDWTFTVWMRLLVKERLCVPSFTQFYLLNNP